MSVSVGVGGGNECGWGDECGWGNECRWRRMSVGWGE